MYLDKYLLNLRFYLFLLISFSVLYSQDVKGLGGNIFKESKQNIHSERSDEYQKDSIIPVPNLTGRIVDLTNTLTYYQIQALSEKLEKLEREKGAQIVVLIIPTTGIESIEEYSIKVAEKWKIGREGIDDGVILLIAMNDRKIRLEIGYGLEGAIPDAVAKRIIDDIIVPEFKKENFYGGINKGVDAIINLIKGEELPLLKENPHKKEAELEEWKTWIAWSTIIFSFIVHFFIGHFYAIIVSTILFSIISFIIFAILGFNNYLETFFIILICSILGVSWYFFLFLGILGGGSRSSSSSRGGFSSGGGFSGGGGSFGGGGASGRW
jgi:uncharacterized protein